MRIKAIITRFFKCHNAQQFSLQVMLFPELHDISQCLILLLNLEVSEILLSTMYKNHNFSPCCFFFNTKIASPQYLGLSRWRPCDNQPTHRPRWSWDSQIWWGNHWGQLAINQLDRTKACSCSCGAASVFFWGDLFEESEFCWKKVSMKSNFAA